MSKISDLIARLCPNGVEYKSLGELGDFYTGLSGKGKDDFKDGNAKFITYMNVYSNPGLKVDVEDRVKIAAGERQNTIEKGDVLFTGSSETPDECGMSSVLLDDPKEPLYLNSFCFGFRLFDKERFEPGFLKHLFRSYELRKQITRTANGVTRFNVSKVKMAKVNIPVPPLEVQREVVEVLDKFALLTAELTAELEKRKKQYEHYRDKLLNFRGGGRSEWLTLGEVILSLNTGLNPRRFFQLNTDDAMNYYVTIREMHGGRIEFSDKTDRINDEALRLCNNRSNLEKGDVLFSGTGTIGEMVVLEETPTNWNIKEGVYTIKPDQTKILSKFLRYILMSTPVRLSYLSKVAGGTVKSISMGDMKKIKIPLPTLEKQAEVVALLDRFDKLCNDLTSGLPAEIAARKKQYEYYRDKLLTFKKAG